MEFIDELMDELSPEDQRTLRRAQESGNGVTLRLIKALYGLKQGSREWNRVLMEWLVEQGFRQSDADPCLFIREAEAGTTYLAVYVDDLLYTGSDQTYLIAFPRLLEARFKCRHMGEAEWVLGIRITRDRARGTVTMTQDQFIKDLLHKNGLDDCRTTSTPAATERLNAHTDEPLADQAKYRSIVGGLLYLSNATRPDVACAVSDLSRYVCSPKQPHWEAAIRVLRYLKGSRLVGITFGRQPDQTLLGYTDADWAGDVQSRRSTTGWIFLLFGGALSWRSKLQATVALSTAEAEYIALSSAAQEAMYLRTLCKDFNPKDFDSPDPDQAVVIHVDNQAAIAIAKNPAHHQRTKHIDTRHHFIREQVESKTIALKYVPTNSMVADMLTKNLRAPRLRQHRASVMGIPTSSPDCTLE